MKSMNRRDFIRKSSLAAVWMGMGAEVLAPRIVSGTERTRAASANEKILLGLVGCGGMGSNDLYAMMDTGIVEVVAVCDVDDSHSAGVAKEVESQQGKSPKVEKDFRRVIGNRDIDAVVVGTPDHWHALVTIYACRAGKDVYVEKPLCHEIAEGLAMIKAARQNRRVVQQGTQLRSTEHMKTAVEYVRSGKLGKIGLCRAWIVGKHSPLSHGPDRDPPKGVNYDMWLGPAPRRRFNPDCFHVNWRWFKDYGTGQFGDRAVHLLDIVRWAMNVDYPEAIASTGGIFYLHDGRDTPDTQVVTFDFPGFSVVWEHRMWCNHPIENRGLGFAFYGSEGTLVVDYAGWKVYSEAKGEVVAEQSGSLNHDAHVRNFLECVKNRKRPNADVETGYKTTSWCLLGTIAQRLGRKVHFDARRQRFIRDDEANRMLSRPYRAPWRLPA